MIHNFTDKLEWKRFLRYSVASERIIPTNITGCVRQNYRVCTRFIWFKTGYSNGILQTR
jgi:hypothetical protein